MGSFKAEKKIIGSDVIVKSTASYNFLSQHCWRKKSYNKHTVKNIAARDHARTSS